MSNSTDIQSYPAQHSTLSADIQVEDIVLSSDEEPLNDNEAEVIELSDGDDNDYDTQLKYGNEDSTFLEDYEGYEDSSENLQDANNCGAHSDDRLNTHDEEGRVLVNVNHPPDESSIYLPNHLSRVIKPHQIGGVRFLYDNVIESLSKYERSPGVGCILAHSMGLGKTIQVISFIEVFLSNTSAKHVLCIVPINTLQNWMNEFDMWLPRSRPFDSSINSDVKYRDFIVYILNDCKTFASRAKEILTWRKNGGVLLLGYEMYRILTTANINLLGKKRTNRNEDAEELSKNLGPLIAGVMEALVDPGPDLIICDEGHRIKNCNAATSQALKKIKTRRRIVLTGYPLQNNLIEYWCMVDFVRPNFLGSKQEFSAMFERPIAYGQCVDSTPADRKLMRYRAHVLCTLLRGFVQRRSHSILTKSLPAKHEHVILTRMTPIQKDLMLGLLWYLKNDPFSSNTFRINPVLLYSVCCKIWNHPDILYKIVQEGKSFDDLDIDLPGVKKSGTKRPRKTGSSENLSPLESSSSGQKCIDYEWAKHYFVNYTPNIVENGMKMIIFFQIVEKSLNAGEKLLVFSQSLFTLDIIEKFLSERYVPSPEGMKSKWSKWVNYYRIDGSTSSADRERLINHFNSNKDVYMFLLSTRAGCLGINLIGANRLIVFDASWNPCHDAQAACRVYRYGQQKECYIYRLICDNSLEKKIYDRQISKQEMSHRVVDELNPETNFTWREINSLIEDLDKINEDPVRIFSDKECNEYEDEIIRHICREYPHCLTKEPFEHESLLLDKKETRLSQREKKIAEESYLRLKQGRVMARTSFPIYNTSSSISLPPRQGGGSLLLNNGNLRGASGNFIPSTHPVTCLDFANHLYRMGHSVKRIKNPEDIRIPSDNAQEAIFIPKGHEIFLIRTSEGDLYIGTPEGRLISIRANRSQLSQLFAKMNSHSIISSTSTISFTRSQPITYASSSNSNTNVSPDIIFLSDNEDEST